MKCCPTGLDPAIWGDRKMEIMKVLFKRLPGPLAALVGICLIAGNYLLKDIDPPATGPFTIICVLALILLVIAYRQDRRSQVEQEENREAKRLEGQVRTLVEGGKLFGSKKDLWKRPMLQLPLRETLLDSLRQVLVAVVNETHKTLSDIIIDSSKIRANIFFPTSEGVRHGDVCNLVIPRGEGYPQGLQVNMCDNSEREITFRPNQGATGRAFIEQRAIGVFVNPEWLDASDTAKRGNLDRWIYVRLHPFADHSDIFTESGKGSFEMTDFQNRRVVEALTWIVSIPIFVKFENSFEVVGVLNVDCIEYAITSEQLLEVFFRISPYIGVLAGILRGVPTDLVSILRFRE